MLGKRKLPKYGTARRSITDEQRQYLLDAEMRNGFAEFPFRSEEERRFLWFRHRVLLLQEHISERPGTRPSAWWDYEAPEPRRLLSGKVEQIGNELYYGMPRLTKEMYDESQFETEYDYLKRLGLLFDLEKEGLSLKVEMTK